MVLIVSLVVTIFILIGYVAVEAEGKDGNFGGGTGVSGDPDLIEDVIDLQEMNNNLDAHYAIINDIDANDTVNWNKGKGFEPIGKDFSTEVTGSLDGRGNTIIGLYINRPPFLWAYLDISWTEP